MVEFHAWAVLRTTAGGTTEPGEAKAMLKLVAAFAQAHFGSGVLDVREINGEVFLWSCGLPNHSGPEIDGITKLFSTLAKEYPGSYGLLFVRDDEHSDDNCFRVVRLARGVLSESVDKLLSPCIPVIENEVE